MAGFLSLNKIMFRYYSTHNIPAWPGVLAAAKEVRPKQGRSRGGCFAVDSRERERERRDRYKEGERCSNKYLRASMTIASSSGLRIAAGGSTAAAGLDEKNACFAQRLQATVAVSQTLKDGGRY